MISSPIQASDEMNSLLASVLPEINTVLGYTVDVRWQGLPRSNKPDTTKIWLRVLQKEFDETKRYVSVSKPSNQVYTHVGIYSIEIFGPINDVDTWKTINDCAIIIRNKFRVSSPLGISFYSAKIKEAPTDNDFYKVNVIIDYNYDESGAS